MHEMYEYDHMVSALQTPWHRLGEVSDRLLTPAEAFVAAKHDWHVGKHPAFTRVSDSTFADMVPKLVTAHGLNPDLTFSQLLSAVGFDLPIEGKFATVREDKGYPFGVVGTDYTTFQNSAAWEIIEAVGSSILIETAGSLKNGRKCWALAQYDRTLKLPGDQVMPYLLFLWSHDGSSAVRIIPTPVRVVCDNTLRMALAGAMDAWSAMHTSSIGDQADQVKRTLRESRTFYDVFEIEVRRLIETTVEEMAFESILQEVVPDPPVAAGSKVSARKLDNAVEKRGEIRNLYHNDPRVAEHTGTAWGVLQAFNTHDLWFGTVHGEAKGGDVKRMERQATRILSGETLTNTRRVQDLLAAVAA